ncbi:MAG: inorganic phosphate transporter [Synechococcales cyanobacterium RU_4_20]|nr:inorganic phosphate transporter [Synechococcales cyanobacterium RU_4_20]NJR67573.1 inorganic phosphate transporter [Synechococcales cyanobacterium CRU_2_2]
MLPTLIFAAILALYLAFNLGANDVANAMGTSVGSKAITLTQAIALAGVMEFAGAILLGHQVSQRLINDVIDPGAWSGDPQPWLWAMLAVLLTGGVWLNLSTLLSLPVSASHTVVGALAGAGLMAAGPEVVHWASLGQISLAWAITPLASGAIAAGVYSLIRRGILMQEQPLLQLREGVPGLAVLLFGVFGAIVFPALQRTAWVARWLDNAIIPAPALGIGLSAIGALGLVWVSLKTIVDTSNLDQTSCVSTEVGAQATLERVFGRFQVVSAGFVAFAHGANDVGNAVAPLGAIAFFLNTGQLPGDRPEMPLDLPFWILALGGVGLVLGLAILGKRVIATIGEGIIPLQPSSGFCAELATALTVLLASGLGLPVSTSHALIGAVVGVAWVQDREAIAWGTLQKIAITWGITIPAAAAIAAVSFAGIQAWAIK